MTLDDFIKIWIIGHGGRALIILIGSQILIHIIRYLFNKRFLKFVADIGIKDKNRKKDKKKEIELRLKTIRSVVINVSSTIIYIITITLILAEFQVNIGPILAGAGIAGLAVGFGSKKLVEDYIAGLFVLIENQFVKGDTVEFLGLGVKGKVYGFNLRRTVILGQNGELIYVPNGQIARVVNYSKMNKSFKKDESQKGTN